MKIDRIINHKITIQGASLPYTIDLLAPSICGWDAIDMGSLIVPINH